MAMDAGTFMVVLTARDRTSLRQLRLHLRFLQQHILTAYGPQLRLLAQDDQAGIEQVMGADSARRQLAYDHERRPTAAFLREFEAGFLADFLRTVTATSIGSWFDAFR